MRVSSVTLPSCERDVEVHAHEDALARGVQVLDRELVHVRFLREPVGAGSLRLAPIGAGRQARRSATNFVRSATRQL